MTVNLGGGGTITRREKVPLLISMRAVGQLLSIGALKDPAWSTG